MADIDTLTAVTPSATPSEADIAAWQALPRDEQLRRLKAEITRPDASVASTTTFADIRAAIAARRASRQDHG
jgi:hypothetical protein